MANGIVKKGLQIKAKQTLYTVSNRTVNAHSGFGVNINVSAPTGYKLLTHTFVSNTGIVGMTSAFEDNQYNLTNPYIYVTNNNNNNVSITGNFRIIIVSLFVKED